MAMIEVTVVIPTHNRADRLLRTIATVVAQDDVDLEIVVVDDGSTDATVERLAARHPDIRTVRLESQRGLAVARNNGIDVATGEWVAFLDDDDLWSPRKLRTQLDAAGSEAAPWAFGAAFVLDEHAGPLEGTPLPQRSTVLDHLMAGNAIPAGCSNVIARRSHVRELGGFDPALNHLADWDLFVRLAATAPPAVCDDVMVAYVSHSSNMGLDADVAGIIREFDYVKAKHAVDVRPFWRWLATNQQRAGRRSQTCRVVLEDGLRHRDPSVLKHAVRALVAPARMPLVGEPCEPPEWAAGYV
jgi:glycosyltransferase involved in cell wall biosynthesis